MIKFHKSNIPAELDEKSEHYTKLYIKRLNKGRGSFYWNKYPDSKGIPISQIILERLLEDSNNHCAYCDKFPLWKSDKTIDHFKPKTTYPYDAYKWSNLFPACDNCQTSKLNKYSFNILKPDEITLDFNEYFMIDYTTFKIYGNPIASVINQERANTTIEIFNLNDYAHITSRRHTFERYRNTSIIDLNLNDFAYRYMF